jgi:hypothetical protein
MPGVGVSEGGNLIGIGFPGREVATGCELPPQAASAIATAQAASHVAAPALGRAARLSTRSAPDRQEDLTNQPPFLPRIATRSKARAVYALSLPVGDFSGGRRNLGSKSLSRRC